MNMTVKEAMDYIADCDINGFTLTENGRNAAIIILEKRQGWTPVHAHHLELLRSGKNPMPFKLARTVTRTRLGDALDMMRDLNRKHIKNQKSKLRRKAAKARRMAMEKAAA